MNRKAGREPGLFLALKKEKMMNNCVIKQMRNPTTTKPLKVYKNIMFQRECIFFKCLQSMCNSCIIYVKFDK